MSRPLENYIAGMEEKLIEAKKLTECVYDHYRGCANPSPEKEGCEYQAVVQEEKERAAGVIHKLKEAIVRLEKDGITSEIISDTKKYTLPTEEWINARQDEDQERIYGCEFSVSLDLD